MSWWKPLETSLPEADEDVTPGFDVTKRQRDAMIEHLAQKVVSSGMEIPAVMMLEMSKPVSFILSQAVLILGPVLYMFMGTERVDGFAGFLNSRENLEMLIKRIEELTNVSAPEKAAAGRNNKES